MDVGSAIALSAGISTMIIVAVIIANEKIKAEKAKRRELVIENAKLKARINAMTTDQQIACGCAIRYDELAKRRIETLERELEYKEALLRQKWANVR